MKTVILMLFWVTVAGDASSLVVRFKSMVECEAKRPEFILWLPGAVEGPIKEMAVSECLSLHGPGRPS